MDLKPAQAKKLILEIISDTSRVLFSDHALQRMQERKINATQILCCLKHGKIVEFPYRDIKTGDWKMVLETVSAGDIIKIVIAFSRNNLGETIVVVTVI